MDPVSNPPPSKLSSSRAPVPIQIISFRRMDISVAEVKPIGVCLPAASSSFSTFCSLIPLIPSSSFRLARASPWTVPKPASLTDFRSFLLMPFSPSKISSLSCGTVPIGSRPSPSWTSSPSIIAIWPSSSPCCIGIGAIILSQILSSSWAAHWAGFGLRGRSHTQSRAATPAPAVRAKTKGCLHFTPLPLITTTLSPATVAAMTTLLFQ